MASSVPDFGQHRLGHLLWEVSGRATALGEVEFAGSPLSFSSIGVLDRIAARPGVTIAEMSRQHPTSPQALSQVAGRLERLGYVERRLGRGRGVGLHLTASGEAARAEGHEREKAAERRLRGLLGEADFEELRTLLERARERLTAAENANVVP